MSDADELRERLWDWADQILDLWNIEDTNPPSLTEGFADLLLPVVAAVVAEARTEALETALNILLNFSRAESIDRVRGLLAGVGNQNAEPEGQS